MEIRVALDDFKARSFEKLKRYFPTLIIDNLNSKESLILRLQMRNDKEAAYFLKMFSKVTNTDWIVYRIHPKPKKIIYHKTWLCQYTSYGRKTERKNANCPARLSILIKKINKNTAKNDYFLKLSPPLAGVVTVSLLHSHQAYSSTQLRSVDEKIEEQIYPYAEEFSTGATHFYETKVLDGYHKNLTNDLVTPMEKQIAHLHNLLYKDNVIPAANMLIKSEELPSYDSIDFNVKSEVECTTGNHDMPVWCTSQLAAEAALITVSNNSETLQSIRNNEGVLTECEFAIKSETVTCDELFESQLATEKQKQNLKKHIQRISRLFTDNMPQDIAKHALKVFREIKTVDDLGDIYFVPSVKVNIKSTSTQKKTVTKAPVLVRFRKNISSDQMDE